MNLSESDFIADIQRVADQVGRNPSIVDYAEHGDYDPQLAFEMFDGWEDAREQAGVEAPNTKWGYYWHIRGRGSCQKCGEDHTKSLVYHHVDESEKVSEVRAMVQGKEYTLDQMKSEIDKCILVCANCHRKIHDSEHPLSV